MQSATALATDIEQFGRCRSLVHRNLRAPRLKEAALLRKEFAVGLCLVNHPSKRRTFQQPVEICFYILMFGVEWQH